MRELIDKLYMNHNLTLGEWETLIASRTPEDERYAASLARDISEKLFGKRVYFRGIIEFTNICRNNCLYCGIRRGNASAVRYRLDKDDILTCCREGFSLGYRTFVLQGGEDAYFTDEVLCEIVAAIRAEFPECAITLSVGERTRESYRKLYESGANRYLLRHETADPAHYARLHAPEQSFENRMRALRDLRELGFQTGAGMMVGSPYQTAENLARDMEFLCGFKPQMIGMGPFIPHADTPFRDFPAGSAELTLFLLSLSRIAMPPVLLPATTALGTVESDGRARGILAGANVIMPNLSPLSVRKKYMLYNGKAGTGDDAAAGLAKTRAQVEAIGYTLSSERGDYSGETR